MREALKIVKTTVFSGFLTILVDKTVKKAVILPEVMGSDHCPVEVEVDI